MPHELSTTVVVPTRDRPGYLEVTLASIAPQVRAAGASLLVVSDGPSEATRQVAQQHGADFFALAAPTNLNTVRNAGVRRTSSELIVFVDDDVEAPSGWFAALLDGVRAEPSSDVFGGPIRARLEGGGPPACGREPPPITTLDLGPEDRDVSSVWGANMAIRRRAFDHIGLFAETMSGRGDEEEWQRRYAEAGGKIRYIAAAGLDHRRTAADSTVRTLARAAYAHGRAARRFDVRKGTEPALHTELRTLAGCAWHTLRRRCAFGIVMGAHTAGRLREAAASRRP